MLGYTDSMQNYRVPSLKKDVFIFYHSNGYNFLYFYICCFSFGELWFLYHFGFPSNRKCSFFNMGSSILEHTWNDLTNFLEERYLGKWSLKTSVFYSISSSKLGIKKPTLPRMKNFTPEIDKSSTLLSKAGSFLKLFTRLTSNSIFFPKFPKNHVFWW